MRIRVTDYFKRKKITLFVIILAFILAFLYYNNNTMQNFITESKTIQSVSIFLIITGIGSIFVSITFNKELNKKDVADIAEQKKTTPREVIKSIDDHKRHMDRVRGRGRNV